MTQALQPYLKHVAEGGTLTASQAQHVFGLMVDGDCSASQLGALLMALRLRGETSDEITGAARAMRERLHAVPAPDGAVDTCGTGGDGRHTFNISTAAALIVAGCGVPVAKHGNRAVSSRSGAADVLEALGVNLEMSRESMVASLGAANITFLFAPNHHTAMGKVAPIRRELGMRTIFNLLGPLLNPAQVRRQVVGVFAPRWLVPMAEALRELGSERAWIVRGGDGLDELTTTAHTDVAELHSDGTITSFQVTPEDAGLPRAAPADLIGGDAAQNAAALTDLLAGQPGPYRDIAVQNAAAAQVVAGKAPSLRDGAHMAAAALDAGKAAASLRNLVDFTNRVYA